MKFRLRFPKGRIQEIAKRYEYPGEDHIVSGVAARVRKDRFYTRADFLDVCRWKTPRSSPQCERNSEAAVHDITALCLSTKDEEIRISGLTVLHGVSWPTSSVLLHFGHRDKYPILDVRALWSLGWELKPQRDFNFEFWWNYVRECRTIAAACGVPMRVLDRALWQFSKENQIGAS